MRAAPRDREVLRGHQSREPQHHQDRRHSAHGTHLSLQLRGRSPRVRRAGHGPPCCLLEGHPRSALGYHATKGAPSRAGKKYGCSMTCGFIDRLERRCSADQRRAQAGRCCIGWLGHLVKFLERRSILVLPFSESVGAAPMHDGGSARAGRSRVLAESEKTFRFHESAVGNQPGSEA